MFETTNRKVKLLKQPESPVVTGASFWNATVVEGFGLGEHLLVPASSGFPKETEGTIISVVSKEKLSPKPTEIVFNKDYFLKKPASQINRPVVPTGLTYNFFPTLGSIGWWVLYEDDNKKQYTAPFEDWKQLYEVCMVGQA